MSIQMASVSEPQTEKYEFSNEDITELYETCTTTEIVRNMLGLPNEGNEIRQLLI